MTQEGGLGDSYTQLQCKTWLIPSPRRLIGVYLQRLFALHRLVRDRVTQVRLHPNRPSLATLPTRMNVVLPLGRLTYTRGANGKPLQLTAALGRPVIFWLLDSLQLDHGNDVLWVVVSDIDESSYQIYSAISAEYRNLKTSGRLRFVPLHFKTRHVVETLYVALQYMTADDLEKRTLCVNGDMIFNSIVSTVSRSIPRDSLVCFVAPTLELAVDEGHVLAHEYEWCHCKLTSINDELSASASSQASKASGFVKSRLKEITYNEMTDFVMVGAYAFGTAHLLSSLVTHLKTAAQTTTTHYKVNAPGFPDLIHIGKDVFHHECVAMRIFGESFTPLKCENHVQNFIKKYGKRMPTAAYRKMYTLQVSNVWWYTWRE